MLISEDRYIAALNELIALLNKYHARSRLGHAWSKLTGAQERERLERKALIAEIDEYQDTHPKYKLVCIKEHYAGQGISFSVGDVHSSTWLKHEAEATLEHINSDWNGYAWEIQVDPPKRSG